MNHVQKRMLIALSACTAGCVDSGMGGPAIADVVAAELSIQPAIVDDDPQPADGKVAIVVQFFRGNEFVQLASNTAVICNGVQVPYTTVGYATRVPLVAPGGSLAFVHSRAGVTTQAVVRVPLRPVLTAPTEGESVARSSSLAIRYVAATSAGVRPSASDGRTEVSGGEQADNGTATLDVSTLGAGGGGIQIARRVASTLSGTGFQSVQATYTISSAVTHITWQ